MAKLPDPDHLRQRTCGPRPVAGSLIETGPLPDKALIVSERESEMFLFSGSIGHAKNPPSHRDVYLTRVEAARLIVFASHLLDIVEQRSAATHP
jgi:hypothetical protein